MKTIKTVEEARNLAALLRQRKLTKDVREDFGDCGDVRLITAWKEVPYFTNGVPCGDFADYDDIDYETTLIPQDAYDVGTRMVIVVRGYSMIEAGIFPGDDVYVKPLQCPEDGDIVVVRRGNENTVKMFRRLEDGSCWLVPQNSSPKYSPIEVTEDMRLVGKVVKVMRRNPRCNLNLANRKMQPIVDAKRERTQESMRRAIAAGGSVVVNGNAFINNYNEYSKC